MRVPAPSQQLSLPLTAVILMTAPMPAPVVMGGVGPRRVTRPLVGDAERVACVRVPWQCVRLSAGVRPRPVGIRSRVRSSSMMILVDLRGPMDGWNRLLSNFQKSIGSAGLRACYDKPISAPPLSCSTRTPPRLPLGGLEFSISNPVGLQEYCPRSWQFLPYKA